MSISPGSTIGPYQVLAPLGAGAMGVVFRARDVRLQREVAIKMLPEHLAKDPDRLARFQREAQVLASLNHPNIAQIYGLEQVSGHACIVMELVEGETLADRLKSGPIPHDEAIDIAKQIADALAAAHERGVIHRDLKPANIKLSPNDRVKVLDFGLAKAMGPKASEVQLSTMATVASGGSIAGTVLGTPGYMSPEQARGKEVDARTDVWSFGCVLYEMLTARQAFEGETATDIMAKIVTSPPALALLPPETPSSTRMLLATALNKNATQRLQHIGDSRLFLDGTLAAGPAQSDVRERRQSRGKLAIAALAFALAIAAVPAILFFQRSAPTLAAMRLEISFPEIVGQPIVSPDGQSIAYVAQPADGRRILRVRPIGSEGAQQLAGTEDVSGMIWSHDSRRLAFVAEGKLKKVELSGGPPQQVADVGNLRGGEWGNGVILLARVSDNVIVQVPESGGAVTPVTKLDETRKETLHALPTFLPDKRHFIYVSLSANLPESGIFLASLDSSDSPKRLISLVPQRFNGMAYASGHLLISNEGKLSAYPMSADGVLQGESIVLAEELEGWFSVSDDGLLLYRKSAPVTGRQLTWFDRAGKPAGEVGSTANYGNVDLSPSGDRAVVDIVSGNNRDIWVIDLARSVPQRVTFDPSSDWTASWSPNGDRVVFASSGRNAGNLTQIYEKSSNGAGMEIALTAESPAVPVHWSPDNEYIIFSRVKSNSAGTYDTWLLPLRGERKERPFLQTPFDKFQARVAPNSRWIAYSTNESGVYQIVVQTFPDPNGGKWQISAEGGVEPKWRRDGRELYYLALDGKLMSVPIETDNGFEARRPSTLFQTPLTVNRSQPSRDRRYDVSPDGRFLMITPAATGASPPITALVNWPALVEK